MRFPMLWLCRLLLTLIVVGAHVVGSHAARLATEEGVSAQKAAQRTTPRPRVEEGTGSAGDGGSPAKGGTIHLNFRNADIVQIINLMSELTGKNFLVDDKVRGKITIIAPKPVTAEEAYQVFLSVLEIQGFTVVPQGPIIKIIPSRDVKDNPIPTGVDSSRPFSSTSDVFVTQLIPLDFADVNEVRGLLTPLVSKESSLLAYTPTNTLILTDTASNIGRLLKIIRAVDVESPTPVFKVVALKHAQAEPLANSLRTALEGLAASGSTDGGGASPAPPGGEVPAASRARRSPQGTSGQKTQKGPRIIPDTRTNSLVLIATRTDMVVAEDLIAKLDVPTPEGRGQIHVYYLKHANAEELAQVLTAQAGEITRTLSPPSTPGADGQRPPSATPSTPGITPPPGAQTTSTAPPRRQGVSGGTTPSGISIVADKPTNALVITASPEAYAVLRDIIQKLDIRRSQVLVESLIAEVSLNRAQNLGVEWRVINNTSDSVFAGSTGSGQTGVLSGASGGLTDALSALGGAPGLLLGILRNRIRVGDNEVLNIPLLIRAFQGDSDVNILATPNLLTTDNEEAKIFIGENRPFLRQAQDTPSGGIVSTVRSFDFKDVGISLQLTPQISQGKTVRLKLSQEVTAFVSEAELGAPVTTQRKTTTTVIVDNDQTIVIGGLIQNDVNDAKTQVPCLGNIPLFGWAFKQTSSQRRKTNLLIFLTPHIVSTSEDIDRVTTHKRLQSDKAPEIERRLREGQPQEPLELLLN